MILEGIITTVSETGKLNIAPLGPTVDPDTHDFQQLILRPFQSSQTYRNLKATRQAVFHVVDDALLLAEATIGAANPPTCPTAVVAGQRLASCCRYYELQVEQIDDSPPRATMTARVVASGRVRDFWGWNRAKHAVLEAAILASRVHILDLAYIEQEMQRLRTLVDKTAGPEERQAFLLLESYVRERTALLDRQA